jgi:hypothetical protein
VPADEPEADLYALSVGASVHLRVLDLMPGLGMYDLPSTVEALPGGSLALGSERLHKHVLFQIDPGAVPGGTATPDRPFTGTFALPGRGPTGYADSAQLTLSFAVVPEPSTLCVLLSAGAAALRRRNRRAPFRKRGQTQSRSALDLLMAEFSTAN